MLAIRNFGHFWSRDAVAWGKPGRGSKGRLLGYVMQDRQPLQVDFHHQIGIYVLFTTSRDVVYIGQAGSGDHRLFERLRHHTRDHLRDRWTNFSWFAFRTVNPGNNKLSDHQSPESVCKGQHIDALNEIEAVLLQLFEPRLNKMGPRWGNEMQEYFQYVPWEWDEEVEAPMDPATERLTRQVTNVQAELVKLAKLRHQ